MSDHAELREAARQSIDGCNEKLKALLADFDRVIDKCVRPWPAGGFTLPVIMVNNPPHDMCYGNYCWYPTREAAVADLLKGSE